MQGVHFIQINIHTKILQIKTHAELKTKEHYFLARWYAAQTKRRKTWLNQEKKELKRFKIIPLVVEVWTSSKNFFQSSLEMLMANTAPILFQGQNVRKFKRETRDAASHVVSQ